MQTVLTTADIAERKRFQFWQDAVCDTFVELDCQTGREERFFGEITTADCDGLHFSTVRSESQTVRRTRNRIHRAREEVMLISLQVRGVGIVAQDGREARLEPGDFACYDSTRPYTLNFDAAFEQLVLHMPRDAMVRRIGRTELWTARRIEGASPVGSLVLPFVRRTASIVSDIAPATASRLSETCLSLVTAALGERLSEIGHGTSPARTALLFRAKAIIESHLHDHALNTEKVAELIGISPRYVQDLFRADGTTVSDFIWKRRLDKSRRDLADPLRATDSIAQIALACGFADFGHFSRRYRDAFNVSPREDRVLLRGGGLRGRVTLAPATGNSSMKHLIVGAGATFAEALALGNPAGNCPPLIRDFARKMWANYTPHPYLEEYLLRIGHPDFDHRDPRILFFELEEKGITNVERFMEFVWENREARFPVSDIPPAGYISGLHMRMSGTSFGPDGEPPATFWGDLQYHGIGNALQIYLIQCFHENGVGISQLRVDEIGRGEIRARRPRS